jgi:hypothetical protein
MFGHQNLGIRIVIQPKMLDPDPYQRNTDPQPLVLKHILRIGMVGLLITVLGYYRNTNAGQILHFIIFFFLYYNLVNLSLVGFSLSSFCIVCTWLMFILLLCLLFMSKH